MNNQINIIKQYFNMWLSKDKSDLTDVFTSDVHYSDNTIRIRNCI